MQAEEHIDMAEKALGYLRLEHLATLGHTARINFAVAHALIASAQNALGSWTVLGSVEETESDISDEEKDSINNGRCIAHDVDAQGNDARCFRDAGHDGDHHFRSSEGVIFIAPNEDDERCTTRVDGPGPGGVVRCVRSKGHGAPHMYNVEDNPVESGSKTRATSDPATWKGFSREEDLPVTVVTPNGPVGFLVDHVGHTRDGGRLVLTLIPTEESA